MIKAVVFDLDDTLCPEIEYVKSGFNAIAEVLGDKSLGQKLMELFKENRFNVYQRAGFSESDCKHCIEIYRSHKPQIKLSKEVKETLISLKQKGYKLGIITDGRPEGQWNKIYALDLKNYIDHIIVTDELGGVEFRKPNPKAYMLMKEKLEVEYNEMVYVGDNPAKDFIAPKALGMNSYCLDNPEGFYYMQENVDSSIKIIKDITEILEL